MFYLKSFALIVVALAAQTLVEVGSIVRVFPYDQQYRSFTDADADAFRDVSLRVSRKNALTRWITHDVLGMPVADQA